MTFTVVKELADFAALLKSTSVEKSINIIVLGLFIKRISCYIQKTVMICTSELGERLSPLFTCLVTRFPLRAQ